MRELSMITIPALPFPVTPGGDAEWRVRNESHLDTVASARTDYFVDPGYTAQKDEYTRLNADTLLGQIPDGDFVFSARVSVDFANHFDAGVLLMWRDDRHWAKLCFEYSREGEPLIVSVVTRELGDDANAFSVHEGHAWLRIVRMAHIVAFHASADGEHWRMVRVFTFGPDLPFTHLGFLAQSPNGNGCAVHFDDINFSRELPADIRAGA